MEQFGQLSSRRGEGPNDEKQIPTLNHRRQAMMLCTFFQPGFKPKKPNKMGVWSNPNSRDGARESRPRPNGYDSGRHHKTQQFFNSKFLQGRVRFWGHQILRRVGFLRSLRRSRLTLRLRWQNQAPACGRTNIGPHNPQRSFRQRNSRQFRPRSPNVTEDEHCTRFFRDWRHSSLSSGHPWVG